MYILYYSFEATRITLDLQSAPPLGAPNLGGKGGGFLWAH